MKYNIAIIMGGYSNESKISLKSGKVVYENLPKDKYNIYCIKIARNNWYHEASTGIKYNINLYQTIIFTQTS